MSGGASRGLARNQRGGGNIGRGKAAGGCGFVLAFAEDALERGAGKPDKVTAGVHVEGDGLGWVGAKVEGEDVVAAWGEWEGNLTVAVAVAEAGG